MKTKSLLLASLVFGLLASLGAGAPTALDAAGQLVSVATNPAEEFSFVRLENGLQIHVDGFTKNVLFYGPEAVRVNTNLGQTFTRQPSLVVVAKPAAVPFQIRDTASSLSIISERLRIDADKKTGALIFFDAHGKEITREKAERPSECKQVTISGEPTYEVKQTFTLAPDESLYGLGQYEQRPYMDYRGQAVLLVQTNIGIVVPFLISTKRYGIMWDIYSKSTFKDDAGGASFWAESAPAGVDYYFIAGEDMDGVIAGYRKLTGAAPMYPKQAYGLFMSKERYKTQDELIQVTRNFRQAEFPLDYIVQDWQYWGTDHDGLWSGMIWNKDRYPDPAAMTRTLHDDLHAKLMVSIWPSVGNDTDLAHELDAKGLRFGSLHWISKQARVYDAYSPEGRAIYFKYIKKGLLDVGVDALWMDGTEVEVGGACHDAGGVEYDIKGLGVNAMGDFTRYLNPYSLLTTKGTYEGQRATDNKRVVTLTRSAFTGQQRYAALPWSGDTTASWETFRAQISGGLNVCMAGLPYWTQDTGGFFVNYPGGNKNPEYRELYARWHQFAIFNPMYRIHGTSIDREPYLFKDSDPETYRSLLGAANLRYQLLPYIYGMAWRTTSQGYTMMRGLPMDFPDDPKVRQLDDEFMFGPAFLVHPVTRAILHPSDPPAGTIPADVFQTPDGKPGVSVEYFQGQHFEKSVGKTVDAKIDYTWPGPPLAEFPAGLTSGNDFSGRWEGTITMPESGEYEFGAEADDGERVWIDGKLIVDDWGIHATRWKSQRLTFQKGQKIPFKIEYFQAAYDRALRFGWKMPSQLKQFEKARAERNDIVETYLPAGSDWFDFWTNERFAGGQVARKRCSLDTLPLYVRAGSIVPMGPVMQYATEKPDAPYKIRVYPGANAQSLIYEDDNETYDYEKGQYAAYGLSWDDVAKTLTIGTRHGSFRGMLPNRQINVSVVGAAKNVDLKDVPLSKTVSYTGQQNTLEFGAGR